MGTSSSTTMPSRARALALCGLLLSRRTLRTPTPARTWAASPDVPAGEQEVQVARGPPEGAQVELPGPGRQREVGEWLGRYHDGSLRLLSVTGPSVRERR